MKSLRDELRAEDLLGGAASVNGADPAVEATIVTLEEFTAADEPGAGALLGDEDSVLIPEGGDVMLYGDGGAGKTTLSIDMACHLGAGEPWLEIAVARPVRVLVVENEGPRPLLRRKMRRKLKAWTGAPLEGRISVLERPWGQFTLATLEWRAELAAAVKEHAIDVLIAGPLTRIGMDAAGTLQEVVAFTELVADVRCRCERLLTVVLIHHENKGGTVSGAWEGASDTLLHVQAAGNGHTVVHVQKARWDSTRHGKTLKLEWVAGDGFKLESDRDPLRETSALLSDGAWRTAKEIAASGDKGGIGANVDTVKALLDEHPERFELRSGDDAKALGRSVNSKLWSLTQPPKSVESDGGSRGGGKGTSDSDSPLKGVRRSEPPPSLLTNSDSDPRVRHASQAADVLASTRGNESASRAVGS